jgi:hypothetical protein
MARSVFITHANIELSAKINCTDAQSAGAQQHEKEGDERRKRHGSRWTSYSCNSSETSKLWMEVGKSNDYRYDEHSPAVEVQQNVRPAMQEDPIVPNTPAMGSDKSKPMLLLFQNRWTRRANVVSEMS